MTAESSPYDPIETAWKIHTAISDWTGKVDTKASYTSALETAVFVAILTQTTDGRPLAGLHDWSSIWFAGGAAGFAISLVLVLLVIVPRLRGRKSKREAGDGLIYFGHLRHRQPEQVQAALENVSNMLPALSRQLVRMSEIAWVKHRLLQVSIYGAIFSCGAIGVAALMGIEFRPWWF